MLFVALIDDARAGGLLDTPSLACASFIVDLLFATSDKVGRLMLVGASLATLQFSAALCTAALSMELLLLASEPIETSLSASLG